MCLERFHTTEEQILARESSDVFVDEAAMLDRDLEEGLLTDWTHIIGVDQNATVFQRNARHRHKREEQWKCYNGCMLLNKNNDDR